MQRLLKLVLLLLIASMAAVGSAAAASSESTIPPLPADAIIATVPMGGLTRGPAVDEATGRVYVANLQDGDVSVVESDGTLVAKVATPDKQVQWGPEAIAVDSATGRVFVQTTTGDITVVDAKTNKVSQVVDLATAGAGWPANRVMAFDAASRRLYANLRFDQRGLAAIDADTLQILATYPSLTDPLGVAVDDANHTVLVANGVASNIVMIDEGTNNELSNTIASLPDSPFSIAVDPVLHKAYASAGFAPLLYVVDTSSRELLETIDVPTSCDHYCSFVGVDPSTHLVYETEGAQLAVLDGTTGKHMASWAIPQGTGLAIDAIRHRVYVTSEGQLLMLDATKIDAATAPLETPASLPSTGGAPPSGGSGLPAALAWLATVALCASPLWWALVSLNRSLTRR